MYKKSIHLDIEDFGDSLVVFDELNEKFYSFDEIEKFIWNMLESNSFDEIISAVIKEYDADYEQVKHDIILFVDELIEYKLIEKI